MGTVTHPIVTDGFRSLSKGIEPMELGSKPGKSDLVCAFNSQDLFYMGQRNGKEASDRIVAEMSSLVFLKD